MSLRYRAYLLQRRILRRSEGERVLRETYRELYGRPLDVENPIPFSEKLFTRMVSIHRGEHPLYTRLTDKYLARDYVRAKIGHQYLVKLIWQGKDPRGIPFDELPAKCFVKVNHASGKPWW